MIFSRLRRAKILHCIREYLSDNFHFSGNLGQSFPKKDSIVRHTPLSYSPAFAPPAELKQASNMLGWEIPPPLWRKTPRTPMVARQTGTSHGTESCKSQSEHLPWVF